MPRNDPRSRPHTAEAGAGDRATPDADRFLRLGGRGSAELREKGSRFLGDVFPVASEAEAREQVAGIRSRHHDATHHCWAVRLGHGDRSIRRTHDDGEPSGSAGAPILAAIDGRELTGTLAVVTRWFGGVKLGTAGLVRCYGGAAAAALDVAPIREEFRQARIGFRVDHPDLPIARRVVYGAGGRFVDETYGADAVIVASVRLSREAEVRRTLVDATSGRVEFQSGQPGSGPSRAGTNPEESA